MLNKMYTELRQTKLMIEIPRLRFEINKQDLKGVDFAQLTDLVDEIQKNVKADLQREQAALHENHSLDATSLGSRIKSTNPSVSLQKKDRKTSVDSKSTKHNSII